MGDEGGSGSEYEDVVTSYYGEEPVTAIVTLKVDTKEVDNIAMRVS
jgi:hypothetical protein